MGVHGLTSFLKENKRSLSHTVELKRTALSDRSVSPGDHSEIHLVVDGWSLIYAVIFDCGEPWVYGGEYPALARHVETVVSSWISVGIKPTFVFDGPAPPLKYPTIISRLQDNCVKPANLFFRTSSAARSTPRSLSETRIAPPLAYQSIISALLCMEPSVTIEFAEGEADPYIVTLAARLGAYVAGKDSDFLVLNCEGYKGYIPLEDMIWTTCPNDEKMDSHDSSAIGDVDESGFQIVTKRKQTGRLKTKESRTLGTGLLPPLLPVDSDMFLTLAIYEPIVFARYISLPPSLLPLLGALIGNDYASFEFFRFTESPTQRVQRVADTLASVLKEVQSGNFKKIRKIIRSGQGNAMDVIGTTVERLLLWRDPANPPESGQIEMITEMVVQSTLEYALDNPTLLLRMTDLAEQNDNQKFSPLGCGADDLLREIMEVYSRGSCFPRLFLEDPDRECCARSIGRPVREVMWSILSEGGGIPEQPEPSGDDSEHHGQPELPEDEEELVDVVEEPSDNESSVINDDDEDPLAALRGKLKHLNFPDVEQMTETVDPLSSELDTDSPRTLNGFMDAAKPSRRKVVTDYIRRGVRVVGEDIEIRELRDFLPEDSHSITPVQLRPMDERLRVFLQALGSDTHLIREIAAERTSDAESGSKLLSVVTLRWVLKTLDARAQAVEDGSRRRERNREKWTRSEAQAFIVCLYDNEEEPQEQPPIDDRAVQLTAQILASFEACGWLAQALLLVEPPVPRTASKLPIRMGEAEKLFSGRKFHSALAHSKQVSGEPMHRLWTAVEEGLEAAFREVKAKKHKKVARVIRVHSKNTPPGPTGMFGALAGLGI